MSENHENSAILPAAGENAGLLATDPK